MEKSIISDGQDASIIRGTKEEHTCSIHGRYEAKCFGSDGKLKWEDVIDNVIMDLGANLMLDTMFGGSQNTAYFLGLISSVGYASVPVASQTIGSHGTWTEAGDSTNLPQWSTPASNARATLSWSAASGRAKAISSAASFTISAAGTVKGCFVVTGSGAVATHDSAAGTLYSAGLFSGGDKAVGNGDTLQVSYTTSLT